MGVSPIIIHLDNIDTLKENVIKHVKNVVLDVSTKHVEQHVRDTKNRIKYGYSLYGYKAISFMYAKLLATNELDPSKTANVSDEEISRRAIEIQREREGMIVTGKLLAGISSNIEEEGNTIKVEIHSSAPYSSALEKGFLFGKHRPGRERPFLRGKSNSHIITTVTNIRMDLLKKIGGAFNE